MPASRRLAALAVAASFALSPAAALAQNGAGDEQYSDPFSGTSTTSKPKAKPQAKPQAQTQAAPSATTTQQSTPAPATATTTPSAPAQQSSGQLPRTGYDVLPLALLGVVLIGGGVLLLRRGAHGRRG